MKKTALLIISLLSISAVCAAGCNEAQTGDSDTDAQKSYNIVQEETDDGNGNCKDGNCEDNDCKDGHCKNGRPEFRFVEPENRKMPPHKPHKRHGNNQPSPLPVKPETN